MFYRKNDTDLGADQNAAYDLVVAVAAGGRT